MTAQLDRPITVGGYRTIQVTKVASHIGAEVRGVRAGAAVPADQIAELKHALAAHKVVFLRDQQHADDVDQRAFAELLGNVDQGAPHRGR